jgi:DNA-binding MarR family transcriptional regulator
MSFSDGLRNVLTLHAATPADRAAELRQLAVLRVIEAGENVHLALCVQLARVGLTLEGFRALAVLAQAGPAAESAAVLARKMDPSDALLGHALTRLEHSRLIFRQRNRGDRRLVELRLTPLGRTTLRRAFRVFRRCVARFAEPLGSGELKTLSRICEHLEESAVRLSRI